VTQKIKKITRVAPLLIPNVRPPTPKKNTRNRPLNRPEEIPRERAMPPNTPPSHLSFAFLVIFFFREENSILITLVKKSKKNENMYTYVGRPIDPRCLARLPF
jgi:hypothetical protein